VGRHEELWRIAEYRAVFGEAAGTAYAKAGSGAET
jgi:ATP-binding cassette subfamily B protein